MRWSASLLFLTALATLGAGAVSRADEPADALIEQARVALASGKHEEGLALARKALARAPASADAHFLCGQACEALARHEEAVAAFGKAIELNPKAVEAYHHRGCELFKLGRVKESLVYFDKYLEKRPERAAQHWQRGISCYYAGRFKEGQAQFEHYQTHDSNDVENGVWRYLCQAKVVGTRKAREAMLKIGPDQRVPMKEIYGLFGGKGTEADVFAAVKAGNPSPAQLKERVFYAHLYLGLYYDSEGKRVEALDHLNRAVEQRIGHYMWDVAHVHRDLLQAEAKK